MQEVDERFGISTAPDARGLRLKDNLRHILRYWMYTEVHVYGFAIAANVLLSFFPFLIVIYSLCRHVFGWQDATNALDFVLADYFPDRMRAFMLGNNLPHRSLQIASVFLLLFTANGVFEPLEVALNRCWGIARNRSFFRNQVVSLGLIFLCGTLGLASSVLSGISMKLIGDGLIPKWIALVLFKMAAVPMSILMLFLVYWLLPNGKISAWFVLPPAIFVGLALELLKYVNLLTWPLWRSKLHAEYGPFYFSVTIILWSFLASMIFLAGAEWAARASREKSSAQD